MKNKLVSMLTSRRFLFAVGGVIVVVAHDVLGIPEETSEQLVLVAVAWIVGDSLRKTE